MPLNRINQSGCSLITGCAPTGIDLLTSGCRCAHWPLLYLHTQICKIPNDFNIWLIRCIHLYLPVQISRFLIYTLFRSWLFYLFSVFMLPASNSLSLLGFLSWKSLYVILFIIVRFIYFRHILFEMICLMRFIFNVFCYSYNDKLYHLRSHRNFFGKFFKTPCSILLFWQE